MTRRRYSTPKWRLSDARLAKELYETHGLTIAYGEAKKCLSCGGHLNSNRFRTLLNLAEHPNSYVWAEEVEIICGACSLEECDRNVNRWRKGEGLSVRSHSSVDRAWRCFRVGYYRGRNTEPMPKADEDEFLKIAASTMPSFAAICRAYNDQAAEQGYRLISENTLRERMLKLNLYPNDRPPRPFIPMSWLSKMAGIPYGTLAYWVRKGLLKSRFWRTQQIVSPHWMRGFLDEHYCHFKPQYLTPALVRWLQLELHQVHRLKTAINGERKHRVEMDGVIYPDMEAAAQAVGTTAPLLRQRMYRGAPIKVLPPVGLRPISSPPPRRIAAAQSS